ncbi:SUMF1/EgtB/PvdO family nonheme iron enzyme [Kordiimonas sp. SCSIO 12603]|uniref:SUMF1/EgtB/PvdO family nonheme iron enzyme n=1 Tax=Kordiimonas sp. SCSIO 12603 TaxID=2829596 RepID=UPI0021046D67|nr:SUMF1/EgtB/PvdO family nonheme iron enzyme [Kordiimonas sp. SCSIO 12603]UTW60070.1 SUMF1/EgtB/PvdO family nonheme iron enzyme [Kordiimonas sp. SCSIO 12603]
MQKITKYIPLAAAALLGGISAQAQEPIEPIMVTIPAATFEMGSEDQETTKPVHTVNLKTFSMGIYEVTVKEYRRFVEATNYDAPQNCRHEVDDWMKPFSEGSWDSNFPTRSEYMPVVCIGWKGANAYAEWIAKETGKPYRLPSEAEWEYAALGGARTKFHFGDDPDGTEICAYANTSDLAGENFLQRSTNTSYVNFAGGKFNCVDHEGFTAVVGTYKPNQFGLYNMISNVFEFLADCYHPNYEGAPTDGRARTDGTCERRVVRGNSWHWKANPLTHRAGFSDFVGGIEGFRLALDGEAPAKTAETQLFETELAAEQTRAKKRYAATPAYPATVQNLKLDQNENMVTLSWDAVADEGFHTYRVYRNFFEGGRYRLIADNLMKPVFRDANAEPHIYEYRVVAVQENRQGDYSNSVITKGGWIPLTSRLEAEHFSKAEGTTPAYSHDEHRLAAGVTGRGGIGENAVLDYQVDIQEGGTFELSHRVASIRDGKGFELWLDGKKLATSKILNTGGYWEWKTQPGDTIRLTAGRHHLQIRSLDTNWKLNWIGFAKIS